MGTNKFFAWQETKAGLIFITVFDLFFAYVFLSFAIDSGSLLDYFIAAVLFAIGVAQGVKLFRKLTHHDRK
jgi:hypothetical protein